MAVVLETTAGIATIDLHIDERPKACLNFLKLCQAKYYNNSLIFSIERNFVAQMGDPTNTGRGGESIFAQMYGEQAKYFEEQDHPIMRHDDIGLVSMVNCASKGNLFGSQFFITLGEHVSSLDGNHLVFGHITEGFDFLQKLNSTITDEVNRPFKDILITHTVILEDPFPHPDGLTFPDESPKPSLEMFEESRYIPFYEDVDNYDDLTEEQIKEIIEDREAKARATVLHMVRDLPEEDAAPPENVLFICKLNPVTTSEDLEIIFSRFGKIVSCEVIMDKLTERSLQYGFIEFDNSKACEDAYFKMDNVLIDERRVHVDFSQSVSKMRWKGKGRIEYFDEKPERKSPSRRRSPPQRNRGRNSHGSPVHRRANRSPPNRNRSSPSRDSRRYSPVRKSRQSPPSRNYRRSSPSRDYNRSSPSRNYRRSSPARNSHRSSPRRDSHRSSPSRDSRRSSPSRDSHRSSPARNSHRSSPRRDSYRSSPSRNSCRYSPPRDSYSHQSPPRKSYRNSSPDDRQNDRHKYKDKTREDRETKHKHKKSKKSKEKKKRKMSSSSSSSDDDSPKKSRNDILLEMLKKDLKKRKR